MLSGPHLHSGINSQGNNFQVSTELLKHIISNEYLLVPVSTGIISNFYLIGLLLKTKHTWNIFNQQLCSIVTYVYKDK